MIQPEDFKEIKCPFHGDDMKLVAAFTHSLPIGGPGIKGEYRGNCGCVLQFDTGTYWVMKPEIHNITVKVEIKS